jgi:hypothetical protein
MPLPNLIHPVSCTIEPIDTSKTVSDRKAREPIRSAVKKTAITILAQPGVSAPYPDMLPTGLLQRVQGYLVVRRVDTTAAAWTPTPGDRITKVGWRTMDVYVLHIGDAAHYTDQQGSSLFRVYYGDRDGG